MITRKQTYVVIAVLAGLAFVAFTIPFFTFHKGLPTGDSQKSIIWAKNLLASGQFPNYQKAILLLNRDPVDFYTPALHALTAVFLSIGGLTGVGISAIILSILAAAVAAAIAYHVLPDTHRRLGAILTFIILLTHERFLRYVREPGYHYQNIVGELLLFVLLLLGFHLLERWRWKVFAGMITAAALLLLTHQFSAFLAFFAALPLVVTLAFRYRRAATILIPFVAAFLIVAIPLGLHEKFTHIFTSTPHLLSQTPDLMRTLSLMGTSWMIIGIAGLVLLSRPALRLPAEALAKAGSSANQLSVVGFLAGTIVLLILSQGPRLNIDIPPIRALFYLAIPLSITGAYFLGVLWQAIQALPSKITRLCASAALAAFVILFAWQGTSRAFTLSHTLRTNSTLTPGQLSLIEYLQEQEGGATLVDDYNRRSASWLVLSGYPMFTRIASDLETQMNEARQSQLRYQLYLNQLDFEKIFSLGSHPEITQLMKKHGITYLTGIDGSSTSHFSHNPALEEVKKVDDIRLFKLSEPSPTDSGDTNIPWLLRSSTLANDIGDLEDTYEHLPASLRATRLSEPQTDGHTTFRTTTAPLIPLKFNVGDYVRILWDSDAKGQPDASLELLLQLAGSSFKLSVITSTGKEVSVPASGETVKISAGDVLIDDEGFITFTINNPGQQTLPIDLIALGLAHTP